MLNFNTHNGEATDSGKSDIIWIVHCGFSQNKLLWLIMASFGFYFCNVAPRNEFKSIFQIVIIFINSNGTVPVQLNAAFF